MTACHDVTGIDDVSRLGKGKYTAPGKKAVGRTEAAYGSPGGFLNIPSLIGNRQINRCHHIHAPFYRCLVLWKRGLQIFTKSTLFFVL